MTAAVQARSLTITVNGNDWSQNLVSFEIGFESYSQGTGLILKTGTLVLCNVYGDARAIDPIEQTDFSVGNTVSVKLPSNVAHPLGNSLKILAAPEVSSIDSSIPEIEGNLVVSIPVGCNLAYFRTKQSDEDKTGVTLGTGVAINTVIQNLLNAAGIPSADIDIALGTDVKLFFPYSKNGGGFVDLAGEFTYSSYYSSTTTNPRVLYCDSSNIVKNLNIISPRSASYSKTITIGVNDRTYQRQLDLNAGAGVFKVAGIKRKVKNASEDYPYTDITKLDSQSESSKVETTYYLEEKPSGIWYGPDNPGFTNFGIVQSLFGFSFKGYPDVDYLRFVYNRVVISEVGINKNYGYKFFGTLTKFFESRVDYSYFYQFGSTSKYLQNVSNTFEGQLYTTDDKLAVEIKVSSQQGGDILPDEWRTIAENDPYDLIVRIASLLLPGELSIVKYFYGTDNIISKTVEETWQNLCILDRNTSIPDLDVNPLTPDNVYGYSSYWFLKSQVTSTWIKRDERYTLETTTRVAAIVNNPTLTGTVEERTALQCPAKTTANIRGASPPATQYWEGTVSIKENQLAVDTIFGNGANPNTIDLQIPFLFNTGFAEPTDESDQPSQFGVIEGEIINGRQYQYLIECDPIIFESVTSPLPGVTVVEPTKKRYFLADALTWYHTATETYVAFAGIFAGSSPTGGTTPTIYPTQLVAAPVPSATITVDGFTLIDTISGSADPDE